MPKLILPGCRPTPLASYLKAIGLLRIISEQKDPKIKGWWATETFGIETNLSQDEVVNFFYDEYAPTPIVAPWNGGSGFYEGDATIGITAISESKQERFKEYREVISQIRKWPEMASSGVLGDVFKPLQAQATKMRPGKNREKIQKLLNEIESGFTLTKKAGWADPFLISLAEIERHYKAEKNREEWKRWWSAVKKARTQCNTSVRSENKDKILPLCRTRLPDSALQWLDAVYSLHADNQASYNPVLGTGGNEGRLDFSNNFMQRIAELFIFGNQEKAKSLFHSSILGSVIPGMIPGKIGQYDPGRAGGYNQGMEIETKDFKINPWDFLLAMEGAIVLAGASARRMSFAESFQFTTPFTVRFSPVGFSSRAYLESGRLETWLPLWRNPASYAEIKYLFGEGRSVLGRRMVRTGIEFSRAVGNLGVDRGIDAFERYAFLERRGKSYVALPAGRIKAQYKPVLELLDELDSINLNIDRFFRGFKNIPATFLSARQKIEEAIFSCTLNPDPLRFISLVQAIGNLEELIAMRDRAKKPILTYPLFGLSPLWIESCDDGGVEIRIATALASIRSSGAIGPIRTQMAGVDPSRPWSWGDGNGSQFWFGSNISDRLAGVLSRRLMEADKNSASRFPLESSVAISPHDLMPFLFGECDDKKVEELLWGFTLIDWRKKGMQKVRGRWDKPLQDTPLSRTWCLLKLLHTPEKIKKASIKRESRIISLLTAGRINDACSVAINRLRAHELKPFDVAYEEDLAPVRLLASLLIPIKDQWKLESLVLAPTNP